MILNLGPGQQAQETPQGESWEAGTLLRSLIRQGPQAAGVTGAAASEPNIRGPVNILKAATEAKSEPQSQHGLQAKLEGSTSSTQAPAAPTSRTQTPAPGAPEPEQKRLQQKQLKLETATRLKPRKALFFTPRPKGHSASSSLGGHGVARSPALTPSMKIACLKPGLENSAALKKGRHQNMLRPGLLRAQVAVPELIDENLAQATSPAARQPPPRPGDRR